MNIKTLLSKYRVTWKQIRYILIGFNSFLFWGWAASSRSDAAIPFQDLANAASAQVLLFTGSLGPSAPLGIVGAIVGFVRFIPWIVITLIGSVVIWQTYEGYKEYERENLSGAVKPAMNIIVLLVFVFLADRVTSYFALGI
jgi:fatty acid desaturase